MQVIRVFALIVFLLPGATVYGQITGSNKSAFEKEYIPACVETQKKSAWNQGYSTRTITTYCSCMSDHVVDRATVADVNRQTARLAKILDDAGVLCTGRLIMDGKVKK